MITIEILLSIMTITKTATTTETIKMATIGMKMMKRTTNLKILMILFEDITETNTNLIIKTQHQILEKMIYK